MTFRCAGCRKDLDHRHFTERICPTRSVEYRCRGCRSDYRQLKKYGTTCAQCLRPRRVDSNQVCRACNAESGLKECCRCGQLLPLFISFYGDGRGACRPCRKKPGVVKSET